MIRLIVNNLPVQVADGASVLAAARTAGTNLPGLCYDERTSPQGSCRVCLVSVDGGPPVTSCTTPVREGMAVRTDNPRAVGVARLALELLVSEQPARAMQIPEDRSELVRACRYFGISGSRFQGIAHARGVDHSHPYVKLDRDLCIACGRCVRMCAEVQGTPTPPPDAPSTRSPPSPSAPAKRPLSARCGTRTSALDSRRPSLPAPAPA